MQLMSKPPKKSNNYEDMQPVERFSRTKKKGKHKKENAKKKPRYKKV